jgi:hypothetical protein
VYSIFRFNPAPKEAETPKPTWIHWQLKDSDLNFLKGFPRLPQTTKCHCFEMKKGLILVKGLETAMMTCSDCLPLPATGTKKLARAASRLVVDHNLIHFLMIEKTIF